MKSILLSKNWGKKLYNFVKLRLEGLYHFFGRDLPMNHSVKYLPWYILRGYTTKRHRDGGRKYGRPIYTFLSVNYIITKIGVSSHFR